MLSLLTNKQLSLRNTLLKLTNEETHKLKNLQTYKLKTSKPMAIKKSVWDTILKVIIAVASAVLGAIGGNAMNV